MAALGPGMLVLCITNDWNALDGETVPVKGVVYRIREVQDIQGPCLLLTEIVNTPRHYPNGFRECGFAGEGFKPLDSSALDIFRRTTTDIPEKVEA